MSQHDRLFKQLLTTFFLDFIHLFAPELARDVEPDSVEFLEKENFTDAVGGEHHIVDLLVRVRLRGVARAILIHVENEASTRRIEGFPRRLFSYVAGLHARHGLAIYPIAVLSFETPREARPDRYEIILPGLDVLRFRFHLIQLNRLSWRDYMRHKNPVAAALMSRMRILPEERPRVKLECLRLLATLRIDRAKTRLISHFIDSYLNLQGDEHKLFTKELRALPVAERKNVMQFTNSWIEEGRQEGRQAGIVDMVLRLLRRRIGPVPKATTKRVSALPLDQLERLGEALLDFTAKADLDRWLNAHRPKAS
jgi:hypothetical protein